MNEVQDPASTQTQETNSVPPPKVEESKPGEVADDGTFFDQLDRLLDKLVPSDSVTVQTATMGEVVLPGSIPARLQVKVFRHMRELLEMDDISAAIASFSGANNASVADSIVLLATNENIAEKLGDIFSAAYPNVLDGKDPLDELPLEDLVAALTPFSQRFLKRLGTGISRMAKGATDLQA